MQDDDATREAPADAPLPTTDLGPAPAPEHPLAYSAGTSSMPVIEYRAPRLRPVWIITLVLAAAAAVAAAMFVLGRTTAPQEPVPATPVETSVPVQQQPAPPVAAPPPAPAAPVAPPAAVVPPPTAAIPAPTTTVPPLATPQARIAEPLICSLHNQHPQMQPVDLALTLVDKGIYRTYDEASLVVDLVLADGCHGI